MQTNLYGHISRVKENFSTFSQSGQALLIVVLVMVVALTVGLSLASRSVTTLRNSSDEAASQAAFSAAEAGVEQAVKLGSTTQGTAILSGVALHDKNNSEISNVDISLINGDQFLLNNGNPVFQDDGTDVWLSTHTDDPAQLFQTAWNGTLNIHWGTSADSCADPALEVLIISGTRLAPTMQKYAYDSCSTRRAVNSFAQPPQSGAFGVDGVNGSETFNYRAQIAVSNGLIARIIPLYKAGSIGVIGAGLPIQGKIITSTGTAGVSSSQTVRKISFFQGYDSVPSELFYSLFLPK